MSPELEFASPLAQWAQEVLPEYFVEKFWQNKPNLCINWSDLTDTTPEFLMLSSGELAMLGLIAHLEDRPGMVAMVGDRVSATGGVSDTFTHLIRRLDFETRASLLVIAHDIWLG
jgi:hypothetical protein